MSTTWHRSRNSSKISRALRAYGHNSVTKGEQVAESPRHDERFRRIYGTHFGAVRDYCFRRLAPADANDATAEVFLVVWRRLDSVPAGDATRPYLYGIARNTVANIQRTGNRRSRLRAKVSAMPADLMAGPETHVVQRDEARRVIAALDGLSAKDQELLRLKAWEQLPNDEIAAVMGLSKRAVETRLTRARKKLAQQAGSMKTSHMWARQAEEGGAL